MNTLKLFIPFITSIIWKHQKLLAAFFGGKKRKENLQLFAILLLSVWWQKYETLIVNSDFFLNTTCYNIFVARSCCSYIHTVSYPGIIARECE